MSSLPGDSRRNRLNELLASGVRADRGYEPDATLALPLVAPRLLAGTLSSMPWLMLLSLRMREIGRLCGGEGVIALRPEGDVAENARDAGEVGPRGPEAPCWLWWGTIETVGVERPALLSREDRRRLMPLAGTRNAPSLSLFALSIAESSASSASFPSPPSSSDKSSASITRP